MPGLGDRATILKARKSLLLAEINRLAPIQGTEDTDTLIQADQIHLLQREYNRLVDEETEIIRQRLPDPLDVLPPELWKDLLPQTVDELLTLTLVSTRWCRILTSIPLLWTNVILDPIENDYLAKAMTCLYLSKPLEISLRIELSLEQWEGVAPRIIVVGSRISSLQILFKLPDETNFRESLDILTHFTELSALRVVNLPFPLSTDSDTNTLRIFERMPSLKSAAYLYFTTQMLNCASFSNLEIIRIRTFDQDTVEALKGLRKLRVLNIDLGPTLLQPKCLSPALMLSCLPSVTQLTHSSFHTHIGVSPKRLGGLEYSLWCMGQNLTSINAVSVEIHSVPDLLAAFQRFPCLQQVYLHIEQQPDQKGSSTEVYKACPSIRNLRLYFAFPGYAGNQPASEWSEHAEARLTGFTRLFHSLAIVTPDLEKLTLAGYYMVDPALEYIRELQNLQSLTITSISARLVNPTCVLGSLESQKQLYSFPAEFLDHINDQPLRYLSLSTANPRAYLFEMFEETANGSLMRSPRYQISTASIPSLNTLRLILEHPILSDLTVFVGLKSLVLVGEPSVTWASDFFEEILLRPNQWPLLEHISLTQDFLEWDILILMLERRNFVARDGVKPITALEVADISYKLLYPITQLLSGRFPEREHISEFSMVAIGTYLWNPKFLGCQRCIRMFRNCEVSAIRTVTPGDQRVDLDLYQADRRLAWLYQLPHQRVQADPPISYDIIQWLTGKRDRRLNFAARAKEGRKELYRVSRCSYRGVDHRTLRGCTLDGVIMESDGTNLDDQS